MQQLNRPRGTEDLIAGQAEEWAYVRDEAFKEFGLFGYKPIETPLFEQNALFAHGIGQATDVVGKEMFRVCSPSVFGRLRDGLELKPDEELSLRPEGTAGVVRAAIQNSLVAQGAAPVKLMYAGSMFRAERPQKGRLREFHQIGVECLGASEPSADAELIIMLMRFFTSLGIPQDNMRLILNSMGDDACRPAYREEVREYILEHADNLCGECVRRADTNPLRAFDCKKSGCRDVMRDAPLITDSLCDECLDHHAKVKSHLESSGVTFEEDPRLVRGLDYYTKTVFEVQVVDGLGAQNAIGGGGRYDKLMSELGGKETPGLGFAVGFERIMLALEAAGIAFAHEGGLGVFVTCVDDSCRDLAFDLLMALRDAGIYAEGDHQGRSLKSQFKLADKMGSSLILICGPDEREKGCVTLRDLQTHKQSLVAIGDVVGKCADHF